MQDGFVDKYRNRMLMTGAVIIDKEFQFARIETKVPDAKNVFIPTLSMILYRHLEEVCK